MLTYFCHAKMEIRFDSIFSNLCVVHFSRAKGQLVVSD